MKQCCEEKHVDLLLIGEGEKKTKDCLKINGKQTIKMPKKGEYVKFKNFEKNIITIHDLCRF